MTNEQVELILDLAAKGYTVEKIENEVGVTPAQLRKYRREDLFFEANFLRARQEGIERMVDELRDITEKYDDVQKARLVSDNIKWTASKRKPEIYGDRVDVNLNQTVDLGSAIREAKARAVGPPALPPRYPDESKQNQVIDIIGIVNKVTPGYESGDGQNSVSSDIFD